MFYEGKPQTTTYNDFHSDPRLIQELSIAKTLKDLTLILTFYCETVAFSKPALCPVLPWLSKQMKIPVVQVLEYHKEQWFKRNRKQCDTSLSSIQKAPACSQFAYFKCMQVMPSNCNFCHYIITTPKTPDTLPVKSDFDCEPFQKLDVGLEFLNKFLRKHA